jgi:hypothetical protein
VLLNVNFSKLFLMGFIFFVFSYVFCRSLPEIKNLLPIYIEERKKGESKQLSGPSGN